MTQFNDGKMWALVKDAPEEGLAMKRVPIPEVGTNDVKIKILKTAICGTDVHIWQWNRWAQHTIDIGRVVGHEYVGVIVETGPGARGFNVGDFVSGEGHITCGKCRNCKEGHKENCRNAKGVGVNRDGAFAEYLVIPYVNVWPCSPDIPQEMYAIFDPFGNATHTALSYDVLGEDVLIAGAGPIGCMAAAIVRFAGARHVVVTDFNQYRLDMAKKLGATTTVNLNNEKLEDVMARIGMEEGFDVGLEMSGSEAALNSMIHCMKHGGNIALLGLQETDAKVDLETVIFNGINLKGIYGRKVWDTWYKMTTMIQAGLDISPIITHHFDARDYAKGFETMISGQSGKVILDWTHINDEEKTDEQ
ncbi:MAG: L-threonine 3-dehydrogenase [Solobacterium sp.]|nr:L-threonine 3-dehydrogenase [Solobacterium sp.]